MVWATSVGNRGTVALVQRETEWFELESFESLENPVFALTDSRDTEGLAQGSSKGTKSNPPKVVEVRGRHGRNLGPDPSNVDRMGCADRDGRQPRSPRRRFSPD